MAQVVDYNRFWVLIQISSSQPSHLTPSCWVYQLLRVHSCAPHCVLLLVSARNYIVQGYSLSQGSAGVANTQFPCLNVKESYRIIPWRSLQLLHVISWEFICNHIAGQLIPLPNPAFLISLPGYFLRICSPPKPLFFRVYSQGINRRQCLKHLFEFFTSLLPPFILSLSQKSGSCSKQKNHPAGILRII